MRPRLIVAVIMAGAVLSAAGSGVSQQKTVTPPKAKPKAVVRPGVISLVQVPKGVEEKPGVPGRQAVSFPAGPRAAAAPPVPLSLRDGLEALQKLPGGDAALEEVAMARGKSTANLLAAASRIASPPPSPKVPTDWNAGVVLSLNRLSTSRNEAGDAYLQFDRVFLRGDLLPPAYWPEHDVAVISLYGGENVVWTVPGRGAVSGHIPVRARWNITDQAWTETGEAFYIELGLRDIEGAGGLSPHIFANGAYVPVARVGDSDRYLGVASLRSGFGGIDLLLESRSGRAAFYYLKVQRIPE